MNVPVYEQLNSNSSRECQIKKHYPDFHRYLIEHYPDDLSFSERLYWYYNDINDYPICTCGKRLVLINSKKGYPKFCSTKCSNSNIDKQLLTKSTCLKLYGAETPAQSDVIKDRMKQAFIKHYGVDNPMKNPEVRQRSQSTCIERHGGLGNASETSKQKQHDTMLERYGVNNPMKIHSVRDKVIKDRISTMLERYGTTNVMDIPGMREQIKSTMLERYGVEYFVQHPSMYTKRSQSGINMKFSELLGQYNIQYVREFALDNYRYDFRVGKTLIEINPYPTHNSTWGIFGNPKDVNYHHNKSEVAHIHGYRCIHVWDWDDWSKVVSIIRPKTSIGARECIIKEVSSRDSKMFLDSYHLQGSCNKQQIRLGLYYDDKLVELMTLGTPRYNRKYQYELLRLCTHSDYIVIGGAQKLFKYFMSHHNPKSVISYCDNSKFDGHIYELLGFTLKNTTQPTCHWYNGKTHITDNLLRQRGFDQLFNTSYGKGTSNDELMLDAGFVRIYDCGQNVFILDNERTNIRTAEL